MKKPLSLNHILAQYKLYLKLFLDIMFFSGLVVLVTLLFSLKMLIKYYYDSMDEHFFFLFVIFAVSGISGILIVNELRRMMRTVINESCFVYDNVFCFYKNMSGVTFPVCVAATVVISIQIQMMKKLEIDLKKDSFSYIIGMMLLGISTPLTALFLYTFLI